MSLCAVASISHEFNVSVEKGTIKLPNRQFECAGIDTGLVGSMSECIVERIDGLVRVQLDWMDFARPSKICISTKRFFIRVTPAFLHVHSMPSITPNLFKFSIKFILEWCCWLLRTGKLTYGMRRKNFTSDLIRVRNFQKISSKGFFREHFASGILHTSMR